MKFIATDEGIKYYAKANAGEIKQHYTRVVAAAGYSYSPETLTELEEKQQLQLEEIQAVGDYATIVCVLTNLELEEEYLLRQIGVFARDEDGNEILVVVGQDEHGDRIPAITEKEVEYQFHIGMKVSNAENISFDFSVNDFLRKKYFYEHLNDHSNPHEVTKEQVGLGNVPNVTTNDQTPTWICPDEREIIRSGEKLSDTLGKLERFQRDVKPNSFVEADDPFVLMTETTYKPPEERTKGSLYALATRIRGIIIITFNRYITGVESPLKDKTVYGIEKTERTNLQKADNQYKGILYGVEYREDGDGAPRENDVFYAIKRTTKGE